MGERISKGIVAAAGMASRMWPASKVLPKELFPLGRIPVIVHLLWELMEAGIDEVIIVAAARNSGFITELLDVSKTAPTRVANDPLVKRFQESLTKCSISIIQQTANYGNGTPLQLAAEQFGKMPCVYAFGDDIVIGENATRGLVDVYEHTGLPVMAAQLIAPERRASFGILEYEHRNDIDYVTRVLEKPAPEETSSNLASFGRYVVTPQALEALNSVKPGRDGEIWFTDAILAHLRAGGEACAFQLTTGAWYTVGDPRGYAAAVQSATDEQFKEGYLQLVAAQT